MIPPSGSGYPLVLSTHNQSTETKRDARAVSHSGSWVPQLETKDIFPSEIKKSNVSRAPQAEETKVVKTSVSSTRVLDKVPELFRRLPRAIQTYIFAMAHINQKECKSFVLSKSVSSNKDSMSNIVASMNSAMKAWLATFDAKTQLQLRGNFNLRELAWFIAEGQVFSSGKIPYHPYLLNVIMALPSEKKATVEMTLPALSDDLPQTEAGFKAQLPEYNYDLLDGNNISSRNAMAGFLRYVNSGQPLNTDAIACCCSDLSLHLRFIVDPEQYKKQLSELVTRDFGEVKQAEKSPVNYSIEGDYRALKEKWTKNSFSAEKESVHCMFHLIGLSLLRRNEDQITANTLLLGLCYALVKHGGKIPDADYIEKAERCIDALDVARLKDCENDINLPLIAKGVPSLLSSKIARAYWEEMLVQVLQKIIDKFQMERNTPEGSGKNLKEEIFKAFKANLRDLKSYANTELKRNIISLLANEQNEQLFQEKMTQLLEKAAVEERNKRKTRIAALLEQEKAIHEVLQRRIANV